MTDPARLSAAAQATLNAYERGGIAAALYAVAHHLRNDRRQLAAVATELESRLPTTEHS